MKHFALVTFVLMSGTVAFAQTKTTTASHTAPVTLKTPTDSFSYAIGTTIGKNLKQSGIDSLNYNELQKGILDVVKDKPVLMNDQQAMALIQAKMQVYMAKKMMNEKASGEKFLATNAKRAGVVSLPDGLQYEVITKGTGTVSPTEKDTVVANYAGTTIDGKEFDNSYKRGQPITIPVTGVIKGWTEILQKMHVGDKWKVYIPSELGYGERGAGADIPGGAALIFEMELVDIKAAK